MKLVVVESPAKAKTIEKYLGKDYKVIASKGHIVDLPKSELGIDVDKKYKPKYVVTKPAALKAIKDLFKKADGLILAVDRDREGEAIGWHIAKKLKLINDKGDIIDRDLSLERIVFTEITESAIQEAIKTPREVDMNLVNAQQARRVLDRLVGYKLSPLLWKKIRFGLSAGRVQSVALRLIVDRELERDAFKADEFWVVNALLDTKKTSKQSRTEYNMSEDDSYEFPENLLKFELTKIDKKKIDLSKKKDVESIVTKLEQAKWIISDLESKEVKRSPSAPFTTSTMQQAASSRFGWSAKATMRIAQKLYEAGHITYMRTDSKHLADSAVKDARNVIGKKYGTQNLPSGPKQYENKAKNIQEAHEAIRPTSFSKEVGGFKKMAEQDKKLYQLIWQRALASQMENAKLEKTKAIIDIEGCTFQVIGQRIIFKGFLEVYTQKVSENILPKLAIGQELYLDTLLGQQKFTQPPARYSEASLIKALEAFGIGRPSTYAPTISTILSRKYIENENKQLVPTDTGKVVTKLLVANFPDIVDTGFTAGVEEDLDKIAEGKEDWKKMIDAFYKPFIKNIEEKDEELKRQDYTVLGPSDEKCHLCKKKMVVKLGRYGRFLSCSDFPECKGMKSVDGKTAEDIAAEAKSEKFLSVYQPSPKTDDGRDYILKTGRYGKFWAHPDYPKIKDAKPLEYNKEIFKEIYGTTPKTKDGKKKMILRKGRFGEFWAHPDYPEKKEVIRLKKKEIEEKKQELGLE